MGQRESAFPSSHGSQTNEKVDDGVAWWLKGFIKCIAVLAACVSFGLGIFACISIHGICIGAGLLQICAGLCVLFFEAPCCFQFFELTACLGRFTETRPYWQKGLFYILISIAPIALCFEISTMFGSGAIFLTGTLYGLIALGKKTDRNTMLSRARGNFEMSESLVKNEGSSLP